MIALIPITCWRPDAEMLKCRIIAEGANGPTTPDADAIIDARGDIFVIPDILCTAGRRDRQLFRMSAAPSEAIVDEAEILKRLYQILDRSFEQVIRSVERMGISNRNAALSIGVQRVRNAKEARGLFP
jgi:glutamate dehydrogenase (NAD(P)+)